MVTEEAWGGKSPWLPLQAQFPVHVCALPWFILGTGGLPLLHPQPGLRVSPHGSNLLPSSVVEETEVKEDL